MISTKKRHSALLLVLVLLIMGTFSVEKAERLPSTLREYQNQQLEWSVCYNNFQCADLQVPVDYTNLKIGRFKIRVLRHEATEQQSKVGSLVINPGGPGGSGVDYAYNAEYIFSPDLLAKYDVIGFDPRGVGRSTPIQCLTNRETDASYAADSKPDSQKELNALLRQLRDYVVKCESRTKNIAHYSTADSARDMDILRAALGEKRLNYLGVSYGTYMGTLYAKFFPNNVGRMVLDGAVSPSISSTEQNLTQAIGFDTALDAFLVDCYTQNDCPLQRSISRARVQIVALFQRAAKTPLNSSEERPVTESLVVLGTASALYDSVTGWPQLRTALQQGLRGDGTTFLTLADQYAQRNRDGTYSNNETDAAFVIDCLDWRGPQTTAQIKETAKLFAREAPVFGPYLAYSGLSCQFFPKLSSANIAIQTLVTTPIIIVGTTRDPATPYSWAKSLHAMIRNSRLISLDGDGHTGYGRGSSCVDDAVDRYFLAGILPTEDLSCKALL